MMKSSRIILKNYISNHRKTNSRKKKKKKETIDKFLEVETDSFIESSHEKSCKRNNGIYDQLERARLCFRFGYDHRSLATRHAPPRVKIREPRFKNLALDDSKIRSSLVLSFKRHRSQIFRFFLSRERSEVLRDEPFKNPFPGRMNYLDSKENNVDEDATLGDE